MDGNLGFFLLADWRDTVASPPVCPSVYLRSCPLWLSDTFYGKSV